MRISRNQALTALVTAASALLALLGVRSQLDRHFNIPELMYTLSLIVSIVFLATAVIVLLASPVVRRFASETQYLCLPVVDPEVTEIHALARSSLGDSIVSIERLLAWHRKNPQILHAIVRVTRRPLIRSTEIVGFFCILPLTKKATRLLSSNSLRGSDLLPDHITSQVHKCASYYIAGVAAEDKGAKRFTLLSLVSFITAVVAAHPAKIYTRPITADGLRVARHFGFAPVVRESSNQYDVVHERDLRRDPLR